MVEPSVISSLFQEIQLGGDRLPRLRASLQTELERGGWGPLIAVSGGGSCTEDVKQIAEAVGRALAQRSAVLLSGGLSGVMEAASRGACQAGGMTIGILPGERAEAANQWVQIAIASGWHEGRNFLLSYLCEGLIAIDGGHGTRSEVALALAMGRPAVGLALSWVMPGLALVASANEAVDGLWGQLSSLAH